MGVSAVPRLGDAPFDQVWALMNVAREVLTRPLSARISPAAERLAGDGRTPQVGQLRRHGRRRPRLSGHGS